MNETGRYGIAALSTLWEQRQLAVYCGDAQICHCGIWSDDWNTAFAMARHIVETHNAAIAHDILNGDHRQHSPATVKDSQ